MDESLTKQEATPSVERLKEIVVPDICFNLEAAFSQGLEPLPDVQIADHIVLKTTDTTRSYLNDLLTVYFASTLEQSTLELLRDKEIAIETKIKILFSCTQKILRRFTRIPSNHAEEVKARHELVEEAIGTSKPLTKCNVFNDLFIQVFRALCQWSDNQEVPEFVQIFNVEYLGAPVDVHYQAARSFPHSFLGIMLKSQGQTMIGTIDPYWGTADMEEPDEVLTRIDYSLYRTPVVYEVVLERQFKAQMEGVIGSYKYAAVKTSNEIFRMVTDASLPLSTRLQFAAKLTGIIRLWGPELSEIETDLARQQESQGRVARKQEMYRWLPDDMRAKMEAKLNQEIQASSYLPDAEDMQVFKNTIENIDTLLVDILQTAATKDLSVLNILEVMNLYNEIVYYNISADMAAADAAVNLCLDKLFALSEQAALQEVAQTNHLRAALNRRIFHESIASALYGKPLNFSYTESGLLTYFNTRARLILWWSITNPGALNMLTPNLESERKSIDPKYFDLYIRALQDVINHYRHEQTHNSSPAGLIRLEQILTQFLAK